MTEDIKSFRRIPLKDVQVYKYYIAPGLNRVCHPCYITTIKKRGGYAVSVWFRGNVVPFSLQSDEYPYLYEIPETLAQEIRSKEWYEVDTMISPAIYKAVAEAEQEARQNEKGIL